MNNYIKFRAPDSEIGCDELRLFGLLFSRYFLLKLFSLSEMLPRFIFLLIFSAFSWMNIIPVCFSFDGWDDKLPIPAYCAIRRVEATRNPNITIISLWSHKKSKLLVISSLSWISCIQIDIWFALSWLRHWHIGWEHYHKKCDFFTSEKKNIGIKIKTTNRIWRTIEFIK